MVCNFVTIVASPRPRVGKTLVARLLTDFNLRDARSIAAFDLNVGDGTLAQFIPKHVTLSNIDDLKGQMAIFDRLIVDDGINKVVDLGSASFEPFFSLASQLELVEEAHRHGIAFVIIYLMTPDGTSVEAYCDLRKRWPEAVFAPLHNEIFGAAPYLNKYAPMGSGTVVMRLPLIASNARKFIEVPPFSFADSAQIALLGTEIRIELHHFLQRIYRDFQELYLRPTFTELKSSIQL